MLLTAAIFFRMRYSGEMVGATPAAESAITRVMEGALASPIVRWGDE